MKTYVLRSQLPTLLAVLLVAGCGRDPATLGIRALQEGDLQKAESLLTKAQEQDPSDPTAVMNLAIIHFKNGQMDTAMAGFTQVANLAPKDPRPLEYIAAFLMDNNRWRDAGEVLAEAARREPRSPSIMTAQALVDLYTVSAPAARDRLIQIVIMDPRYAPALFNLAVIERDWLKNPGGGRKYFQRYLALAKNDPHATIARAALAEKPVTPSKAVENPPKKRPRTH